MTYLFPMFFSSSAGGGGGTREEFEQIAVCGGTKSHEAPMTHDAPSSNVSSSGAGGDGEPKKKWRQLTIDGIFRKAAHERDKKACGAANDGGTKHMKQLSIDECLGRL